MFESFSKRGGFFSLWEFETCGCEGFWRCIALHSSWLGFDGRNMNTPFLCRGLA